MDRADPEPKALACYGLWLPARERTLLRFVDGRPISAVTTRFLGWCTDRLAAAGKTALLLVWDNASWHISQEVRQWIAFFEASIWTTSAPAFAATSEAMPV